MSKIAANEIFGGNTLRKCIDYFCHLAVAPEFYSQLLELDREFSVTDYFSKMTWLKNKNGVGVDVYDWGGGAIIVNDSSNLPFADSSFDTITFLACLNHIPNRSDVIREAYRLIRPGGNLVVTMINPMLGKIGHTIWWYS